VEGNYSDLHNLFDKVFVSTRFHFTQPDFTSAVSFESAAILL
jgi:hypothetical protein